MASGFSIVEFMVAMTITLLLLTLIVSQASLLGQRSPRIIDSQERLEALFNTVDFFKSDISSCGKRLQEAQLFMPCLCCETAPHKLTVRFGTASETLKGGVPARSQFVAVDSSEQFISGKEILLYDPSAQISEWARIKDRQKNGLTLVQATERDYSAGSRLIVVKTVTYQHDHSAQILRRKVDRSPAQPMLEGVKDFYFSYFSDQASMLYQIELISGEQVRGYIALSNLVRP